MEDESKNPHTHTHAKQTNNSCWLVPYVGNGQLLKINWKYFHKQIFMVNVSVSIRIHSYVLFNFFFFLVHNSVHFGRANMSMSCSNSINIQMPKYICIQTHTHKHTLTHIYSPLNNEWAIITKYLDAISSFLYLFLWRWQKHTKHKNVTIYINIYKSQALCECPHIEICNMYTYFDIYFRRCQ